MASRILVTDGEQRAALAVVRSLGRAGHAVHVTSVSGRSLAGASRYTTTETAVPDALADPTGFVGAIAELIRRTGSGTLLPITDAAMLALLGSEVPRLVTIPFSDLESFRAVSDKARLMAVAPEVGIAVPEQTLFPTRDAALAADPACIRYPVVLKPARSVSTAEGRQVKLGVSHAAGPEQLSDRVAGLDPAAFPLLVQQRVIGPGVGIFLLLWDGEEIARFAHRRIREKPPAGGVSVYRESIPADPALVDKSRALLDRFGWRGVAMVEYKLDAATGRPYLMEVNGRFWGSLQLAVDAGVDFPALVASLATGGQPDPVTTYRSGVRSRWWWGDVDHLIARMRHSPAVLGLPAGSPGRARALAEFLLLWRPGDRSEVLRVSDPRPFMRETALWLRGR